MKDTREHKEDQSRKRWDEQVRLELINLAVLFRSAMIGRDEFESRARSMGVQESLDSILADLPLMDLG